MSNTFVAQYPDHKEKFLVHINNIDSAIKHTVEDTQPDGFMPFLDKLVMLEHSGTLTTSVHRQPTYKDQYLHWDSHHHLGAKYSVINTLTHMDKAVPSTPKLLRTEKQYFREILTNCTYPALALDRMECKNFQQNKHRNTSNNHNNKNKGYSHTICTGPMQQH